MAQTEKKPKKRAVSNGAKTNPVSIEAKQRAAMAIALRKEGKSYEAIAAEVGYNSKQAAWDAVNRALQSIVREPATELVNLDLERLDDIWGINFLNAQAGDIQAATVCMKIMDQRAKLLGLYAPEKREVRVDASVSKGRSLSDFYEEQDVQAKSGA